MGAGYVFQDVPQVHHLIEGLTVVHHVAEAGYLLVVSAAYDTLKHL